MEINKIYNENCLETMAKMPDNFVDLIVTSPPYDNLRDYNGYVFDFENVANEIGRVLKNGGTLVWIVGDATIKGSETGTSFIQALHFKNIVGLNLNDTMIWNKNGFTAVGALKYRYGQVFEYMFVFSKGIAKTFNPINDRPNKQALLITNR
jgi:DNA modification methylase